MAVTTLSLIPRLQLLNNNSSQAKTVPITLPELSHPPFTDSEIESQKA